MKTAHQFARELLAGPDLPIVHFDPSCAGYSADADTASSDPVVQRVGSELAMYEGEPVATQPFLIIIGNQHEEHDLEEGA